MLVPCEPDYGLKPGDELMQCSKGFTFNQSMHNVPPHAPDKVVVIQEYPRFILVEAHFENNRGKSYKECINKAAHICGEVYFLKMKDDEEVGYRKVNR